MTAGNSTYNSLQHELKPDSALYDRIKNGVLERKKYSDRKMSESRTRWRAMDESFKAYVPVKEIDQEKKNAWANQGKLDYITLGVPYSYAIAMTAQTYLSTIFLSRNPVYQFSGRHGETQSSIQAVEALMDYQLRVGKHLPVLMNWIFSWAKYGVGFIGEYWCKETAQVARIVEKPATIFGMEVPFKTSKVREVIDVTTFEGNNLYNVSVYDVYPDPRVSLINFQKGEFFGRDVRVGFHELLEGEANNRYFNIDVVRSKGAPGQANDGQSEASSTLSLPYMYGEQQVYKGPAFHKLHEMFIRLVPSQWGLGTSRKVEKWVFTLVDDDVVIGAQPLGLIHNEFPFSVIEYGMGSEEFVKCSMIEIVEPLSKALTWLFNSHMYGVRKSLTDTRVVDPSKVTIKDMLQPFGGSIVRLKPSAYGQRPSDAIHQLVVRDPTASHTADMMTVERMMQRALGVIDDLMGVSGAGSDRQTATEVRNRTGFATSRMKSSAEYAAAVGFASLSQRMLMNTQQLYSEEKEFRIAGSMLLDASSLRSMKVNPDMISGFYDFVPVDGTMPIDRLAQANFWKEIIGMISQNPMLFQQWDVSGLLAHVMSMQGERNINKFRIQAMDPMALQQQALMGNVVPLQGQQGGKTRLDANLGATGKGSSGGTF